MYDSVRSVYCNHQNIQGPYMRTIFGTDGIRGTCGTGWLTPSGTYAIGHAVGQWLKQHHTPVTIAIASDTRASRHAIRAWLQSALSCYPYEILDYGVIPTPALVAILHQQRFTCGIMITASHNPYQDNGIKIYGPHGTKLTADEEQNISAHAYEAAQQPTAYEHADSDNTFRTYASITSSSSGPDLYMQYVRSQCTPDLRGITIALDTAAGATHAIAQSIFHSYGAEVISVSPEPTGYNINHQCGSTKPGRLQQHVIHNNADIGFAFDGDGDRIIAINKNGVIADGDDILAILLKHPAYRHQSHVVSTVMSNMGLQQHCHDHGMILEQTAVGDKYVAQRMHERAALLGGEPSGHIILSDIHITGDGIMTALRLLESIIETENWSLSSFEKYTQITYTIPTHTYMPLDADPLYSIIAQYQNQIDGRMHVRYSGTEPVMRLLIESKSQDHAQNIGEKAHAQLSAILGASCNE